MTSVGYPSPGAPTGRDADRDSDRAPMRPRRRGWVTVGVLLVIAVLLGAWGARWLITEFRSPTCEFTVGNSSERLAPEQAANAATISMVAVGRDLPPKASTIALATAIQESKLRNLTYGDRDSVGLFQQRPSQGWGSVEEINDPVYSANAFFDALVAIPDWSDWVVTEIAQEVQRSGFPEAYADHEAEARVMASALVGETPAALGCRLDEASPDGSAERVLAKAERTFGGTGTVSGDTLTLQASDSETAWATASWAVAHAEVEQITRVDVADRSWQRANDPFTWHSTGASTDGTTVTVTVASG